MSVSKQHGINAQQAEIIWLHWKAGHSLSDIARYIGKHPASVFTLLKRAGGISPTTPKQSPISLSLSDREEISRGLAAKLSIRSIAKYLNRPASTISREISRNGGKAAYRAMAAHQRSLKLLKRPKAYKLKHNCVLAAIIKDKLNLDWSPQQISGWLKVTYPDDINMLISHETIYRTLYLPQRDALNRAKLRPLRTKRIMRQSRKNNRRGSVRGQIIDAIPIHDRPKEIDLRASYGHWEGDLVSGSKNSHIATLVERVSRFTILLKVNGKDTDSVVCAIISKIAHNDNNLFKSLTWDRGMELAKHKQLTKATNVKVYFCDPQSPWQRGTNENTNRLVRQYCPRGTNLYLYSQQQLDEIANRLNHRPRKILGFITPSDKLETGVAMTP